MLKILFSIKGQMFPFLYFEPHKWYNDLQAPQSVGIAHLELKDYQTFIP